MPKAFSTQERAVIQQRLIDQGVRLFSTYGLSKTSVDELAQAAGISKGAFYLFYDSKETLFMDVMEQVERRFRQEILVEVDKPGPTPRARLVAVFKKAFSMLETMPILQFTTGKDYDLLFRRIPPERLQSHFASDQDFILTLIARCQQAGIPIQAPAAQVGGLMYPLVLSILHKDEFQHASFAHSIDLFLELIAAYCLGEVEIPHDPPGNPAVPAA